MVCTCWNTFFLSRIRKNHKRGTPWVTPQNLTTLDFWTFVLRKLGWKNNVYWYMLSNVVKIIQKTALTPTFGLCLSTLKLRFPPPQLQRSLALYQGPIFISWFYTKDGYDKYLSFATLGNYVTCLGAKIFKFPWRVFFFCGWSLLIIRFPFD